jgi:hypothetical protein
MRDLDLEFSPNDERDYQYGFDSVVRKYLLERWSPRLNSEGLSLEMGSFDGSMTSQLLEFVDNLEVLEGSPILADQVREKFGGSVKVHVGWFEEFQPEQEYQQIFLVHGLEHVEDPVSVLTRAAGWLAEGGRLFVAVPNANALSRQIATKMGIVKSLQAVTEGERQHGHLRTYNLDTLLQDFGDAGLFIQESGGVVLKTLSNWQFDKATEAGIVSHDYVGACDQLSRLWPDFSSSIYVVASRQEP